MRNLRYWTVRVRNGVRKVAAGLAPFGESVWPGVRNDLFVAHESIYRFFASQARDRRVLDAGCGTGYGAQFLADAGARSVRAVDVDLRSIRYAKRHFAHPSITFAVADLERLAVPAASLDLAVSSNVLEHLERPDRFLQVLTGALAPGGTALLALPPITSPDSEAEHGRIHFHRSNLSIDRWLAVFHEQGWHVTTRAHRYSEEGSRPDFRSPFASLLDPGRFVFPLEGRDSLYRDPPITVLYALTRPTAGFG